MDNLIAPKVDPDGPPFPCGIEHCGQICRDYAALVAHIEADHPGYIPPPKPEPRPPVDLIPAAAFDRSPSAGGVRVRFWDRDFRLIHDNLDGDTPMNELFRKLSTTTNITIDGDEGRIGLDVLSISYIRKTDADG